MNSIASAVTPGPLLIILDNKVVGKTSLAVSHPDGWCSVRVESGPIYEKLEQTEAVRLRGLRYCYFRFNPETGIYLGGEFSDATDHEDVLRGTRVVNKFNLNWGMVPESFKNTEGYRSSLNRDEDEV
jgi:hypothetical protein